MSRIFVTADTHFYDRNMAVHREFDGNVETMNQHLIERWNNTVAPGDTVYHLGDVAMARKDKLDWILSVLNGHKYLVPGNHDVDKETLAKYFTILPPIHNLTMFNKLFVLCHFPIESWQRQRFGSVHLHGHVHTGLFPGAALLMNRFDVGIDKYERPISITQFK